MVRLSGLSERTLPGDLSRRLACLRCITFTRCDWRRRSKFWKLRICRSRAVALEVGYQDNGFFGRLFRPRVG